MPRVLTCPNGHRWQMADGPSSDSGDTDLVCPVCGGVGERPTAAADQHASTSVNTVRMSQAEPTSSRLFTEAAPLLPNYEMLETLGHGGMGIVYKARDRARGRFVAIKVIRQDRLQHAEAVRRFRREAEAAARLAHPNVVLVYESDHEGDTHFLVMEYVAGVTLQRLLEQEGPQPVALACDYVRQAALGLQHAHEQGLVHRDVKPANLMLSRVAAVGGGEPLRLVKILDMGVARLYQVGSSPVESLTTLTQDGTVIGTADFIAPEQLEDPHGADIRADLYSLGCTFYVLLTGRVPFPGGTLIQKLDRQRWETPPAVDQLRRDVPAAVVAVVRRLMAKKPAERYQTPAELADALQRLAGAGHVAAQARPAPVRALRVLAGHTDAVRAVAVAPDGVLALSGGRDRTARLWDVATGREVRSFAAAAEVNAVAFAPDGGRVLWASGAGVRLADAGSGAEVMRFSGHTDTVKALALFADGTRVVTGGDDRTVRVWDAQSGREVYRFTKHTAAVTCVAVLPGGAQVLSGSRDQALILWDVRTGNEVQRFAAPKGQVLSVAVSADGRHALSGHFDTVARLWEIAGGRELRRLQGHRQMVNAAVFCAGDRRVLTASGDQTLRLWDLDSGCEVGCFEGHTAAVTCVAVSPAGILALSGGADRTLRVWPLPG
jgi:WD40 repeat protein